MLDLMTRSVEAITPWLKSFDEFTVAVVKCDSRGLDGGDGEEKINEMLDSSSNGDDKANDEEDDGEGDDGGIHVVFLRLGDWVERRVRRDFEEGLFEKISEARPLKSQGLFLSFCSAADRLG